MKLDPDPLERKIAEALEAQNATIEGRNWVKFRKKTFYAVTKLILNLFFGEFKHRCWFFPDTPNIGSNCRVIWKDLWWWTNSCSRLKYRGGCTIPLFQLSLWCEKKRVAARHYADIGKQLLFAIIETGFAEQFQASHKMGPALICLKISAWIAYREIHRRLWLSNHLLFR